MYYCANCKIHACDLMQPDAQPSGCPSRDESIKSGQKEYLKPENYGFGQVCSIVSMSRDGKLPRVMEIVEVAKRNGYKKLGLAFCVGLAEEAKIVAKILNYHDFIVESVICKVGGVDKSLQGIENGGNAMCNPIAQAELLNKSGTEFNIALGLCVGHDSLFFKYSHAPVTVLVAKDKVLAHNPVGALYQAEGYYKDIVFPKK